MRTIAVALIALGGIVLGFTSAHAAPTEKVLYAFTGGRDGGAPQGTLIADAAGNLYGTASAGGALSVPGFLAIVGSPCR